MSEPWQEQPDQALEAEKLKLARTALGLRTTEEERALQASCQTAIAEGELAWPDLPVYERGRPCPKCGGAEAKVKHIDPAELPIGALPVRFYQHCGMHEALCIHCTDCHYEWFEQPLDARRPA